MADTPLLNTNIYGLELFRTTTNAAGTPQSVPMPLTENVTASSSSASLAVRTGPDPSNTFLMVFLNATVAESDSTNGGGGIMITLSDADNDTPDQIGPFSIVGAPPVVSITNAPLSSLQVTGSQPVPTNTGP